MDIEKAITDGIVFKGGKSSGRKNEEKVKTKAKKKRRPTLQSESCS